MGHYAVLELDIHEEGIRRAGEVVPQYLYISTGLWQEFVKHQFVLSRVWASKQNLCVGVLPTSRTGEDETGRLRGQEVG